jgi:hypothetical protein
VAIEALRPAVEGSGSKVLATALRQVEESLPKILAHLRDPDLPATNNRGENFHQRLEYLPTFKHRMMTPAGAQRAADYRVFACNYRQFAEHAGRLRQKQATFRGLVRDDRSDPALRGMGTFFKFEWEKLNAWFGKYHAFWSRYLARI